MSMRTTLSDDALSERLSDKDIFKIKLSLSCLSNRVVVCGTTASLYLWQPPSIERPSNQWTLERSGVPVLVISTGDCGARNPKGVHVSLVERDSGFATWKETLTSNSNYHEQQKNFHTLMLSNGDGCMAGFRFNCEESANVFLKEVEAAVQEILSPVSAPELNKLPTTTNRERLKKFRKLKKVEISTPCLFSHVTSITSATQMGEGEKSKAKKDKEKGKTLNGELSRPAHIRRAFSMSKRSGETPENKANIIQGQTDTLLSDKGIEQARLAGNKLNDEKFSHIFSSDLKRARKTAEEIIKQNNCCPHINIVEDSLLRERGYGEAEGVSNQRFKQMAVDNNMRTNRFTPKGGETLTELKERASKFLNSLIHEIGTSHCSNSGSPNDICFNNEIFNDPQTSKCETQKQKQTSQLANVLAVSHGGLIRQLLLHCMDDLPSKFPPGSKRRISFTSPNTGLSRLKIYLRKETKLPEFVECCYLYNAEHLS